MLPLSTTPGKKCRGVIYAYDILRNLKLFSLLISGVFLFAKNGIAQTTIFSQNFNSSTSIASYSALIPNSGQFDAIATAGSSTATINSNALRFTRGSGNTSFTRSTNFSPTPTAMVYSFTLNVVSAGGNQNTAATFQVGSSYTSLLNNALESDANTYAQFAVDFRGGGSSMRLRDVTNNNTGTNYTAGTAYTITWAMNNSGSTLTYTAPDGSTETVANDKMDIWVNNTKEFNDVTVETTTGSMTDLKFVFSAGTGTIDIDNINIYSINPFITAQPVALTRCTGSSASYSVTASGTSLSYQWKKSGVALTNGGNISGATSASLTINPVSATDAATDYTVEVTSSGGYTAVSNNTALTITAVPTITSSASTTSVCNSSTAQNASLSYSATTNAPTTYSITWDATALGAGLVNVVNAALPASPMIIPIAAGVTAGTYNGTLTVANAGCTSSGNVFTATVNALPTITGTLSVCTGATTALTGSGTAASSFPWISASTAVATVNGAGLVTGVSAGSSIITYTDNNSCSNTATVTVSTPPAVTGVTVCPGGSGSLTSSAACAAGSTFTSGPNNAGSGVNNTAVGTSAWPSAGNITTTGTPYSTQSLPAGATSNYLQSGNYGFTIPSGATINGITVNIRRQSNSNFVNDDEVRLVKSGVASGSNLAGVAVWPNGSFTIATYGGSSNLWGNTWSASDINASNFGVVLSATSSSSVARILDVDYVQVTVTYTIPGSLNWYTVSSGGTSIGSGTPFNPVGVLGSGLANTNTPGTTTYYAECAANPGCRSAANFIISPYPTITSSASAAALCTSTSAQNSSLSYSATTGTPTLYAVTWNPAAITAGLVNLGNTAITSSPLNIPIAANVAAGTYTGTITVTTAAGCTSTGNTFTILINALPGINSAATASSVCFSSSAQTSSLSFSATTGSPNNYTITWNAAAITAGLVNTGTSALPASPINIPIAAGVAAGTYTGTLTVTNSAGCSSIGKIFTVTIVAPPTITSAATATTKCFSSSAQSSSLSYSATTGSPTSYTITWDAAAQLAGLVNTGLTALPPSPVTVSIAAGVAPGTYNGSLLVVNGAGCYAASSNTFTLTISNAIPVMTSASSASLCSGGTVSIPLTSTIASTYTWIAANNTNVTGESTSLQSTSTLSNTLISSSATAESITYTVTPTSAGGCTGASQPVVVTVNAGPTITSSATAAAACYSTASQTSSLAYSATTNSPISYTITWNAAALSAGLVNVSTTPLPASPIPVPIAASVAAGTYTGTLVVSNGSCSSTGNSFTLTVAGIPTITTAATAAGRCYNTSAQNSSLSYSATTNSPNSYTITWNAAALSAGLVNVSTTVLPASPVTIPIAAGITSGTYTGTITVSNAAGCISTGSSFTITVTDIPTITTSAAATTKCFSSTAQSSSLNYSSTTNAPTNYTITWNAAALTAGLVNVGTTALPAGSVTVPVAANVAAGTYTGTLTVTNAAGCSSTGNSFTITINPLPGITTAATANTKCFSSSGQTSFLTYSAKTNSPNNYSITWNAAALSAGLVNVSSTALPASQVTFPIAAGVAAGTYTGTIFVTNASGCSSTGNSFTLTINAPAVITTQPVDKTVCFGSSTSFDVVASGTSLTYQWRKGTTNLCNCTNYSGVNTATLTITAAVGGNAAADYNCVVSNGTCSGVISSYVSLTVTASATTPAAQATALAFPTVGTTSIISTFTKSVSATNYLVVRTTTSTAPANPVNGTTYTVGTSALGGYIQYAGTSNVFTSTGLTPGTTYYYWVYAYNISACGTATMYLTTSPLSGNATTATNVACGTVTTLYWGGAGSGLSGAVSGTNFNTPANWSTSASSYVASPVAPTQCNNVSLDLRSNATITLNANADVYGLTYTVTGNGRNVVLSTEGFTLTVNGDALIDVLGGNNNTTIAIGENNNAAGVVDFKANFRIGINNFATFTPTSFMVGNVNSKIIFRGDVLFGRSAKVNLPGSSGYPPSYPLAAPGTGTTPGTIEFDGQGLQQVLWNNNAYYDCFYNIVVGNQNKPYVKHVTGTYTPDNILNNLTINDGATVDLASSQWIREQQGGTFTMNGSAKLILGNNTAVQSTYLISSFPTVYGHTGVVAAGSNFPGGFTTMNISPTSTIEYNAGNSITQTVYGTPAVGSLTYGNLILSNSDGAGTANKISTSVITVAGNTSISENTTMTLGANMVSNGAATVDNNGKLDCSTRIVSGSGSFTLSSGGTLAMGSAAGITSSGATGNIQTTARSFSTGGNYIYNGSAAQATGSGLPKTVNDLTILNAAGVTMQAASANYTVAGTLRLTSGALSINGDSLTINNLQRSSGTLTGSATSSVGITGTGIPLFFTSGGRTLKNLFLNSGASADLQTSLDITAGSSAGSVAVASGAVLNTYGYLTLKSDANGTARVAEIPVDGSGNALGNINGNVQIERFIPAKRGWRMLALPVSTSGAPTINDALQEGVVNNDLVYANNQNPSPGYGIHISGSNPALGFDPTPQNNSSLLTFTRATGGWTGIANTLSLTVRDYEGYMVFVRGNRATNLSLNTAAATSTTVLRVLGNLRMGRQSISVTGGAGAYSVLGNPFASTIDFRNISTSGAVNTKNFVLWDPALTGTFGVGAYQYFTRSAGPGSDYTVFPGGGSYGIAGSVSNLVQSGQAFMLQNSGAGTVIIDESSKATTSSSNVFRPIPNNTTAKISILLSSVESDSSINLLDGALMMYGNDFSDSLELEDAKKLFNNSENFGITNPDGIYQIEKRQTINETDTIQYNIKSMKVKNYQLAVDVYNIDAAGMIAYLKDKYSNTETILTMNSTTVYPFSITADAGSKTGDRFKIYFKQVSVVPVTFTSLNAVRNNSSVKVAWEVANEINIRRYEVERSSNGSSFKKLHTLNDVSNNNSTNTYQFTDEQPVIGINYFRIKSIDNNGRSSYSNIAKVYLGNTGASIAVFPNPVVDGKINLYFTEQQPGDYAARLFNNNGQLIQSVKLQQAGSNGNAVIALDKTIPHGNYILEVIKPDNTSEHINIVF